jgi:hypothetical protein
MKRAILRSVLAATRHAVIAISKSLEMRCLLLRPSEAQGLFSIRPSIGGTRMCIANIQEKISGFIA